MKCKMCGEMPCMCHGGKMMMAEGGEAEPMDMDESSDKELMELWCCDELIEGIQKKDKRQIYDSIKAIVLSCGE